MRRSCVAAAIMLALSAPNPAASQGQPLQPNPDGSVTPLVAVRTDDYAQARAAFRTTLTRRGPAPQRLAMPDVPHGVRQIDFPSGQLTLRAWLGMPVGQAQRPPVVIFIHGGFAFGREDFDMAAAYRAAGFAVVTPILRGENGQAGSFSLFYDEAADVVALARFLRRSANLDGRRIYLAGHSTGGTIALLAAMMSTEFRAVACMSASPDQVLFVRHGIRPGDVPFDATDERELQMRSPLSFAASLKSPTRLYYGSEEGIFRLSTQRLAAIARAARLDVRAQEVEGTHMSAVPTEILESIAFFRSH
jgi:dipeptidyl aminopeptidase/acylaminoacyl peptidase